MVAALASDLQQVLSIMQPLAPEATSLAANGGLPALASLLASAPHHLYVTLRTGLGGVGSDASLSQLRHAYLVVQVSPRGHQVIVDPSFREQFELGLEAGERYAQLVAGLPPLFVGPISDITATVQVLGAELQRAVDAGMLPALPPWRSVQGLASCWLPLNYRDVLYAPAPCAPSTLHPLLRNLHAQQHRVTPAAVVEYYHKQGRRVTHVARGDTSNASCSASLSSSAASSASSSASTASTALRDSSSDMCSGGNTNATRSGGCGGAGSGAQPLAAGHRQLQGPCGPQSVIVGFSAPQLGPQQQLLEGCRSSPVGSRAVGKGCSALTRKLASSAASSAFTLHSYAPRPLEPQVIAPCTPAFQVACKAVADAAPASLWQQRPAAEPISIACRAGRNAPCSEQGAAGGWQPAAACKPAQQQQFAAPVPAAPAARPYGFAQTVEQLLPRVCTVKPLGA